MAGPVRRASRSRSGSRVAVRSYSPMCAIAAAMSRAETAWRAELELQEGSAQPAALPWRPGLPWLGLFQVVARPEGVRPCRVDELVLWGDQEVGGSRTSERARRPW